MIRIKKALIILPLIFLAAIIVVYGVGQSNIKRSLNNYWYEDENKDINASKILRCDYSLFRPKVAFVSDHVLLGDINELKIYLYRITDSFSKTDENREFIGVSTVKNTTFPQLVSMVKEDCSQFQKAKGNPDDETINWSYSPAPTQKQLNEQGARAFSKLYTGYLWEAQEVFNEIYGDPFEMTDEELAKLNDRIEKEGVDERVYIKEMTTRFYNTLDNINDQQEEKLREIYGEWENLTEKELANLAERIQNDIYSGKVVLD